VKILFVLGPTRGGMRLYVRRCMEALLARGVDVGCAAPNPIVLPGAFTEEIPVGSGPFEGTRLAPRLGRAATSWGADLLHAHGLRAGVVTSATRLPYAYTLHNFPPLGPKGRIFAVMEGPIIRRAQAVSAVSALLVERAAELGARSPALLAPPPEVPERPLPFPEGSGPTLGTLCRLVADKGVHVLVDAMAEVVRTLPGARLVVGGEGPEERALADRVSKAGLTRQVTFTGWVEDKQAFFRGIDLYVQPSLREGLGLATQEARAAGRAVIASEVGGLPEAAGQGPWVRLVPPGDARSLAAAILSLSAGDLPALGRAGHTTPGEGALPEGRSRRGEPPKAAKQHPQAILGIASGALRPRNDSGQEEANQR